MIERRLDVLAAQIAAQATLPGSKDGNEFVGVFAAMGVTQREAGFFRAHFAERAALEWTVLFLLRLSATALKRSTRPCSRGGGQKERAPTVSDVMRPDMAPVSRYEDTT